MRINPKIMSAVLFGGMATFALFLMTMFFILPDFLIPIWIADYIAVLVFAKALTKREPSIYDVWDENGDE